jgi:hypothetical protein
LAESGSNKHDAVSPLSPAIAVHSDASHDQDADADEDTFNIRSRENKKAGK